MFCNVGFAGKVENLGWKSKRVDINYSCKASSSRDHFKDNISLTEKQSVAMTKVFKKIDEKNKVRNIGFKKYSYRGEERFIVLDKPLGEKEYSKPYGAIKYLEEIGDLVIAFRWFDIIEFNNDTILLERELMEFKSGGIELLEIWTKTNQNLHSQFLYSLANEYTNERSEEDLFAVLFVLQDALRRHSDLDAAQLNEQGYEKPTQYFGNVFEKTSWPSVSYITFNCSRY